MASSQVSAGSKFEEAKTFGLITTVISLFIADGVAVTAMSYVFFYPAVLGAGRNGALKIACGVWVLYTLTLLTGWAATTKDGMKRTAYQNVFLAVFLLLMLPCSLAFLPVAGFGINERYSIDAITSLGGGDLLGTLLLAEIGYIAAILMAMIGWQYGRHLYRNDRRTINGGTYKHIPKRDLLYYKFSIGYFICALLLTAGVIFILQG